MKRVFDKFIGGVVARLGNEVSEECLWEVFKNSARLIDFEAGLEAKIHSVFKDALFD